MSENFEIIGKVIVKRNRFSLMQKGQRYNLEFFTWIKVFKFVKYQPIPKLSSDNICVKATMALMIALDKVETQNRLDSLDQGC